MASYQHKQTKLEAKSRPFDTITDSSQKDRCLIAIPVGIDQKRSVDAIMKKNDLIHGWGIDYKFGYCAQRAHGKNSDPLHQKTAQVQQQMRVKTGRLDMRTKVRRYSRSELRDFQKRWERATRDDRAWVDPFARPRRKRKRTDRQ
uniref:Uncharacterized protein n=1 Tax=Oryza punctata TaxID=4537 RepID=A0A0E0LMA3_ORYPU